ncbi:MAG TPA: tetratricopeptide repeat protein [Chthoniobacterales bacterium]|nr:tetratricopeptide repeat protein [Chthoniobacterales bacterium]
MKTRLCLFTLLTAFAFTARGADDTAFAKANQAYAEGRFQEAATDYENLIRSGAWNANLFYDLGNVRYRLGDFGQAILNYERALALDPRHPEADANLRLARDEARALELRRDWIERYASIATVKQCAIAASVAFWLALFVTAQLFFSRRSAGRITIVALSVLVCGVSIFAIVTLENGARGDALAIVTGKDVEARLATADNAKSVLVLPPGSEIKVLSERGDWIYAALPNDQRGWIPASSAQRVRM